MASPIDPNSIASSATLGANTQRLGDVNAQQSPALNIPNDGQNRQWFLSENTGSRSPISLSNSAVNTIDASQGIDGIANHILRHVGA